MRRGRSRAGPASPLLLTALLAAACAKSGPDPRYRATEGVLEAVAVLRLHVEDDTYRFPPARDFTGKNVYRASLNRLESLEQLHAGKLDSGYLTDVLLFAKARALERLGEFELAARHYERVTRLDSVLAGPAGVGQTICDALARAALLGPEPNASPEEALEIFGRRRGSLEALREATSGSHYEYLVSEELERADSARASYFAARALLDQSLDPLALQQYQELVARNRESKERDRHLLDLADLYVALSRRYVETEPPVSLDFDPATFDEYAHNASRLYEAVSLRDGSLEKIEASRKLEALLAFTLQVYDEKLPR